MRPELTRIQASASNWRLPDGERDASGADLSAASSAWKAIDGATGALVAPGTAGTVRYAVSGTADYTLVRASGSSIEGMTNPGAAPVGAAALALLRSHGLAPIAATGLGGDGFYVDVTGERVPVRGGNWNNAAIAGAFALNANNARTNANANIGARPALEMRQKRAAYRAARQCLFQKDTQSTVRARARAGILNRRAVPVASAAVRARRLICHG